MISFLSILAQADHAMILESDCCFPAEVQVEPETGLPDNQVARLTWHGSEGHLYYTHLTEEAVKQARFDKETETFSVDDFEGLPTVLRLSRAGEVLAPAKPVYVLVQEGGSSSELYLHAHATLEDAEADRVSCAEHGSYRTSSVVEVPADLAAHPRFYEVVEQLVRAAVNISYP